MIVRTLLSIALLLGAGWNADEEKVSQDKLPKAVRAAYEKHFPGATFKRASTEKEDGKTVFEIAFVQDGANVDATFDGDGALVGVEKEVAAKDLPKVVADAIAGKYPKATLKKAEELSKDGRKVTAYEVLLVTAGNETIEVKLDPAGKITNEEKKAKAESDGK
jgi:hypothetical protein